ncbi:MAG TPA: hypothetical protein VMW57_05150 [Methyloceanibacter sp.]|nr:hypothetical protein [Methyloceanibacter sp.]
MKRFAVLLAVAAIPSLALASPEHLATIEAECGTQLKMPPAACACLKGKAGELNDGQQAFIAAVVSKDKATQKDLTQGMTVQELTQAGMFMTNAPAQCAGAQ